MMSLDLLKENTDQVESLIQWWISKSKKRYHRVRLKGSNKDFIQDVWVDLLYNWRDGKQKDISMSTVVIYQCNWTLFDYQTYALKDSDARREFQRKMRKAQDVKNTDAVVNKDEIRIQEESVLLDDAIAHALRSLCWREAAIVRARFGLLGDASMNLEQVGKILKISRERVRQIESKGLRKLREHDRSRIFFPFVDFDNTSRTKKESAKKRISEIGETEYGQALLEELFKD